MSNVKIFSSKQDIQQQACEWISRLDRGLTEVEHKSLSSWINSSESNRQSLFRMAETWDELSVLNELSSLFPLQKSRNQQTKILSHRFSVGIAASLAFVAVSCFAWLINIQFMTSNDQTPMLAIQAQTAVGEQRVWTLADGSKIHLNTDSLVAVDFTDSKRNVHLIRGEAHFEVAHDEQRPFIVKAGNNTVTAVGTAFNVQITNDHTLELLVTEGKVLLQNEHDEDGMSSPEKLTHPLNGSGELMIAGQKALVNQQTIQQLSLSNDQVQKDLAWQQGMLVFHGEPLEEALLEITRYTSINFTLADEQVKQRRVAGYFKAGDIQGLLFALENNFNIVYEKHDEQTIELSSGL